MATKRELKKRRKIARDTARAAIAELSDDDLKNLAHEIGRAMQQKAAEVNELRARLDAVRLERQRRDTVTSTGLHISDHAVLRYLERYMGVDTKGVREKIAQMAQRSGKLDSGEQYSRAKDDETGITIGINGVSNIVTTVFTERENDVFLLAGQR